MTDKDALGEALIIGLKSPESVVRGCELKIADLQEHLDDFPGAYEPLNGTPYIVWERRAMMKIGIVQGWVAALSAIRVLPFEVAERLKHRAVGIINRAMAKVQMGERR
jgi:hypothetical protein